MMPEGGPKDTTPPKIVKSLPLHESTHFKGKTLELVFDKEVDVEDIYNRLIVTPKLKKLENKPSYTYKVRGNTVILTLESPLEEETTYTFNFNDAIKDITEGNVAASPVLTFSTGAQLDAMYVTGRVEYLMTQLPVPQALVALYKAEDEEVNILNGPPDYFITADEEGRFTLDHIKQGNYHIYASKTKESPLTVDLGTDAYGFLKAPIDLTTAPADDILISILQADVREFKLQSQQPQDQYFELNFSKPVEEYSLALVRKSQRRKEMPMLYSHLVEEKQTIRVYNTLGLLEEDSLEAQLTATDVLGSGIEETVTVRFKEGRRQKNRASYKFSPASGAAIKPHFVGTMTLNKPIKEIVTDHLYFVCNGREKVRIRSEDIELNAHRDVVTIKKQLDPALWVVKEESSTKKKRKAAEKDQATEKEEGLVLHMDEEAFVTVEGDQSEAMCYRYTFENPQEYATISGTVMTNAPGFIVQLLDLDYEVLDEIRNERHYQFKGVLPGSYRLRLLILQDKEGEWSFGNVYERREPDRVSVYPEEVGVIANWEITEIDFFAF
ncbi:MAG: Ig-like domain-containing domain [Roseivirga sp.]